MKIINLILIAVVVLLSIAVGAAKLMQVPQEVNFLQGLGLTFFQIMVLGVLQIVGGLLVLIQRTRLIGCVLIAIALLIPTILIFAAGDIQSGVFSLLTILLVVVVAYQAVKTKINVAE